MRRPRADARGFSLIETLVALAIAALVIAVLLDATASGIASNRRLTAGSEALGERIRGETRFRAAAAEAGPLRVESGRLLRGEETLFRWDNGQGRLRYSADGRNWGDTPAALVRFELIRAGRIEIVWIAG